MTLEAQRKHILSGRMYNDLTDELVQARQQAVMLTTEYNDSFGQPQEHRERILRRLLQAVGNGCHFEPMFRCEFGFNISVGDHFYANFDCVMLDGSGITIGDHVLFGPRVAIYTSNHAVDAAERAAGACYAKPVTIGDHVSGTQMSSLGRPDKAILAGLCGGSSRYDITREPTGRGRPRRPIPCSDVCRV